MCLKIESKWTDHSHDTLQGQSLPVCSYSVLLTLNFMNQINRFSYPRHPGDPRVEGISGNGQIFRVCFSLCPGFWDTAGWLGISDKASYPRFQSIILLISPWPRNGMELQHVLCYHGFSRVPSPDLYLSLKILCYISWNISCKITETLIYLPYSQ